MMSLSKAYGIVALGQIYVKLFLEKNLLFLLMNLEWVGGAMRCYQCVLASLLACGLSVCLPVFAIASQLTSILSMPCLVSLCNEA